MTDESARARVVAAILGGDSVWPSYVSLNPDLKDHMLALGVLVTRYNALEFTIYLFLSHFLNNTQTDVAATIFSRLNNQYRVDVLNQYAEAELDPKVKSRLESFLSAYKKCTENRNFLAHAQVHNPTQTLADLGKRYFPGQMVLRKAPKNDPNKRNYVQLEIAHLRQIADDMERVERFGKDLYFFIAARRIGGSFIFPESKYTPPLPDIPPEPHTLTISETPTPKDEKPQPESSGE